MMRTEQAVEQFLDRWASLSEARDAERAADLFLRDPPPLVTFTDGERAQDWLDVRLRIGRDFERTIIEKADIHNVLTHEVGETVNVAFEYDLHVRDMWGQRAVAARHATFTLVHTKDGLRISAAHFSAARS